MNWLRRALARLARSGVELVDYDTTIRHDPPTLVQHDSLPVFHGSIYTKHFEPGRAEPPESPEQDTDLLGQIAEAMAYRVGWSTAPITLNENQRAKVAADFCRKHAKAHRHIAWRYLRG